MCKGRSGSSSLLAGVFCLHHQSAQEVQRDIVSLAFYLSALTYSSGDSYCPPEKCCSRVCHAPPLHHLDICCSILWLAQSSAGGSGCFDATQTRREFSNRTKKQTKKFVLSLKFLYTPMNNCVTGAFWQLPRPSRWWCCPSTTRWWCRTQ